MAKENNLNSEQLRFLRGLCHHIRPVVMIAAKGTTENVMHEIEHALEHHELIKIKMRTDRANRKAYQEEIVDQTGAAVISAIGQTLCLYRENREEPKIALPG